MMIYPLHLNLKKPHKQTTAIYAYFKQSHPNTIWCDKTLSLPSAYILAIFKDDLP
ncbi:hypothetical protein [Campylobacter gastrosuis]|uniref:Transposase n=1 Tax=Campylobacter gastrosuis TaxID=2974576 RepID=A0ABT7HP28_9BACT|nr:hypothetical protein [Campylobacter gastrosuis]MDL0088472.1 hypothetical protein [Campylobacter gastrosuis]